MGAFRFFSYLRLEVLKTPPRSARFSFSDKVEKSVSNRVRASFEWREIKIRWNLFNDLSAFTPSHNVTPDRGGLLAIVRTPQGNKDAATLLYLSVWRVGEMRSLE